jgi:hypothetical protein
MLKGTSSGLYGTVPELVTAKRIERDSAVFYTGILGSSVFSRYCMGGVATRWATFGPPLRQPYALAVVPHASDFAPVSKIGLYPHFLKFTKALGRNVKGFAIPIVTARQLPHR